jgi:hypothetical protein
MAEGSSGKVLWRRGGRLEVALAGEVAELHGDEAEDRGFAAVTVTGGWLGDEYLQGRWWSPPATSREGVQDGKRSGRCGMIPGA